jgi:hypothetical protein
MSMVFRHGINMQSERSPIRFYAGRWARKIIRHGVPNTHISYDNMVFGVHKNNEVRSTFSMRSPRNKCYRFYSYKKPEHQPREYGDSMFFLVCKWPSFGPSPSDCSDGSISKRAGPPRYRCRINYFLLFLLAPACLPLLRCAVRGTLSMRVPSRNGGLDDCDLTRRLCTVFLGRSSISSRRRFPTTMMYHLYAPHTFIFVSAFGMPNEYGLPSRSAAVSVR